MIHILHARLLGISVKRCGGFLASIGSAEFWSDSKRSPLHGMPTRS